MIRKWCITIAVILVLGTAVLAGVKGVQHAKAASIPPVYLDWTGVSDSNYSFHSSYHRGEGILLSMEYYNATGVQYWVTLHPAVYHGSYQLANFSTGEWVVPSTGNQELTWQVTIPKNAPLGTYKYWFMLGLSGYPDQTVGTPFKIIK